jgi:hypothetical protein
MPGPTPATKKFSDSMTAVKGAGLEYLAGASTGGVSMQLKKVTQVGASPFAVTFRNLGLKDMADTDYAVYVNGPNGDERGDPATYTTAGFSIVGGANAEVLRVTIVGRLKGQAT